MESIDKIAQAIEDEETTTTQSETAVDKLTTLVGTLSETMAEFSAAFAAFMAQEKKEPEHEEKDE